MKKITYIGLGILFFYCCTPTEDKVPYNGHLVGEIKYTGASNMAVDNVIITLTGISDQAETISERIDEDGKYDLELPAGIYTMDLEGNRCVSNDLPHTVKIIADQKTTKNINIEQLPSTMVILYNDIEYKSGETITLGSAAVLDIWNKHSPNDLTWEIRAYPEPSWITFETSSGTVPGGGRKSVVFSIDKGKMPNYGTHKSDIVLTTSDNGSFTVTVQAEKEGGEPEKAVITGNDTNSYPDKTVGLTADAVRATSYKWFMGETLQNGENNNTFEAKYSGVYYALGVNSRGEGVKSDGKTVTIVSHPDPPAKATIAGNSTNDCLRDGQQVTLTASAGGATSYLWRRGSQQFNETGNTLVVKETGTYYAIGVNTSGLGQESAGKSVAIASCTPTNPANVKMEEFIYSSMPGSKIKLSWSSVYAATQYKIQVCNNPEMSGSEHNYYTTTNNYYYFYPNDLPCGQKYFRIVAVNNFGESSGTPYSYKMPVSITSPNSLYLRHNYSTQAYNIDYIDAKVEWYEGIIYFEIQRKEDVGPWEIIATITGNTNDSFTREHSYQDYTYSKTAEVLEYRVRAYINTDCGVMEDYAY